jgi:hypothetical protein
MSTQTITLPGVRPATPHDDDAIGSKIMSTPTITLIGGPTALIEIDGFRLLTDPTFDAPGDYRLPHTTLVKTSGPALDAAAIGPVDAVLLSHDQHADNLDTAGRACSPRWRARGGSAAPPRVSRRGTRRNSPATAVHCASPRRRRGTARPASSRSPAT